MTLPLCVHYMAFLQRKQKSKLSHNLIYISVISSTPSWLSCHSVIHESSVSCEDKADRQ